jgi:hypothetical protein
LHGAAPGVERLQIHREKYNVDISSFPPRPGGRYNMTAQYDIFKKTPSNDFVWGEEVDDNRFV